MIRKYLEDLERRIVPEQEETLHARWREFCRGDYGGDLFTPVRDEAGEPGLEWPPVTVNEGLDDPEKMALQQLNGCSRVLAEASGSLMCVRSNYGTGILSSLFDVEVFRMDEETNTLPTTRPVSGGKEAIRRLIDAGVPDLDRGFGGRALEMGEYFKELFQPYPHIARYVHVYHPDTQGPMDICELVWGSGLFLELMQEPELVKEFLELITATYIAYMDRWRQVFPPEGDFAAHWGLMHRGTVMLRDDSAMNLSPEMFREFIEPYDQRLLSRYGGGAIHFCGRGDHYIDRMPQMDGVYAVNLSQPEYNDMERIFRHTIDRGIQIIGLKRDAADAALENGRDLHGNVHCL